VAQVDANGRTQARSGGNYTLGLKSMAQVLKPTLVAQADSSRNLKSAPAAKLLVFSDFSFALAFRKVLFVSCILSPPRVAQSQLLQSHLKSTLRGNLKSTSKVAFQKSALRGAKSTIVVAYQSSLRAATKVDF
jgi:hypothetical protein